MPKLSFDERAEKIISIYLRDFKYEFSKLEVKAEYLENLLFELENQIKFYSLKGAIKRGAKIVEDVDVAKTLKKYGSPSEFAKQIFKDAKTFGKKQETFFKIIKLLEKPLKSANPLVLDAGCGWGRFIQRLRKQCDKSFEMVGVDVDNAALEYGMELSTSFNAIKSRVEKLPLKDSIAEVILCSGVIHEIKTSSARRATVKEFWRVLKPGGMLCIVDVFSTNLIIDAITHLLQHVTSKIEWFSVKSALEKMLKENMFKIVKTFEIEQRAFGAIKVFAIILTKNYNECDNGSQSR